jgi:tetratricopeptide (TPR) repeat protein
VQWFRTHFAELALGTRLPFFAITVVSASLLLAAAIIETGAAASFKTVSQGRWILRLDRDNALLEDRLGQIYQESGNPEGIRHLRRAAELSPLNRRYHADLASACESLGDTACADREWELLAELCPMVPVYQSHAAQSYLRTNRMDEALAHFHRLLELDPSYGPESWFALRAALDPDRIFHRTIPARAGPALKLNYVDFLSNQGDNDSAFRIWQLVVAEKVAGDSAFSFSSSKPYLERLLDLGRIGEAESVWHDLQRLKIVAAPAKAESGNLIFNGDFEQLPLDAGFDWRWSDRETYVAIDFAAPAAYHGAHCLRIDFTVNRNEEYEPVAEFVRVFPNRSYRLEAYVRSDEITSDTGPSLRVSDTQLASFQDVVSQTTVGTTPWHPIYLYFSTGPETQFVRLSVWRPRGRTFPTEISGTFWLDTVSLRDAGPAVTESATEEQR